MFDLPKGFDIIVFIYIKQLYHSYFIHCSKINNAFITDYQIYFTLVCILHLSLIFLLFNNSQVIFHIISQFSCQFPCHTSFQDDKLKWTQKTDCIVSLPSYIGVCEPCIGVLLPSLYIGVWFPVPQAGVRLYELKDPSYIKK